MISSLPPKVIGEIEGRLDILVLRPVLIPSLQSSQAIDFFISWWGDDKHSLVKLLPNDDKAKFVFNICCDINRFQKYLDDAEEVVLEVFVSNGDKSEKLSSPARYLHKYKKDWKNGEYIGSFQIKNVKLNSRGEFVYEGKITNKYGDICGSLVVFMLFTSNHGLGLDSENYFSSSNPDYNKDATVCDFSNQTLNDSSNARLTLENTSFEECHSVLDNKNNFLSPIEKLNHIEKVEHEKNCNDKLQLSYISDADLLEYLPDKSFLISRLFSFVDSGAIQLSDVPTLLQICQERSSPQLNHGVIQSAVEISEAKVTSNNSSNTKSDVDWKNKLTAADQRSIPIHDLYSRHYVERSQEKQNSHADDVNKESYQMNLYSKLNNNSILSSKIISDLNKKDEKLTSDTSLLIIYVSTVNLMPFDKKDFSLDNIKANSSKQLKFQKKNVVRQRSKICYFLQISLYCSKSSENSKSALIVSRQIENGVVYYNMKEILPLPNNDLTKELTGYLKVRVIRRKLGERLGTDIAIGLVSLKNLYTIRDKKAHLKLWFPNKESSNDTHQTIGKLEFSVSFALLSDVFPPSLSPNVADKQVFLNSPITVANDNVNLSHKNISESVVAIQQRRSSDYADVGCQLQQFNHSVNCGSENEQCDDTMIFPLNKITQEKEVELSHDNHLNPHIRDDFLKNYKKSRRKLFDKKSLNLSADTSPQNCCKFTCDDFSSPTKHDTPIDEHEPVKTNPFITQHEEYLNNAQELNYDRSILYADVSSNLEHSLQNQMSCDVLLEIREGRNFPMLISNRSNCSFAPNTYIKVSLKSAEYETEILKNSVSPKWNFRTAMNINREDFIQTEGHFLLLVFHSRNGVSPAADDPLLGYVTLDIRLLWTSFISLSGWIPVLNKDQSICGEINLTLASLKSVIADDREMSEEAMKPNNNSLHKSSADNKESSTQTSKVWCNPLHGPDPVFDCHEYNLSFQDDGFPQKSKPCRLSFIKDDGTEKVATSDPVFSKNISSNNLTSNIASFQPELIKPLTPVGDETFIISRSIWAESDELKNLKIKGHLIRQEVSIDDVCREANTLRQNLQAEIVKSKNTARDKYQPEKFIIPKCTKSNIESFTWMNQLETLDTPCASYIDYRPNNDLLNYTLLKDKGRDHPSISEAVPSKWKHIKCRIAANINMPKYV